MDGIELTCEDREQVLQTYTIDRAAPPDGTIRQGTHRTALDAARAEARTAGIQGEVRTIRARQVVVAPDGRRIGIVRVMHEGDGWSPEGVTSCASETKPPY